MSDADDTTDGDGMAAEELLDEWEAGGTGLRPKRIQHLRDDIMRHSGVFVPRGLGAIETWLERYQSQVTRKLREETESTEEEGD
jgi:hypothetical protein